MLNLFKSKEEPKHIDYVFIGLGNPGNQYARTRHNIGWMTVEAFALASKTKIAAGRGSYYSGFLKYAGKSVMLAIPTTYMNNSGEAVAQIIKKYQVKPQNIVVLVDEYNFPLNKIHLKKGGSDGGHNGTASIIQHIGNDFFKLRIGIDKNFSSGELVEYVLSKFGSEEKEALEATIDKSLQAMQHIIKAGSQRAMSDINSEALFTK